MKNQYQTVARAIEWITQNQSRQPGLDELADYLGASPFHVQRTFQEWAGVTPKQFLKSLTRQQALQRLLEGETVLSAALDSGLSGPGRLHDLLITTEALTPGQVRSRGQGVQLRFGFGDTPFGPALVSWSERGVNFLGFCAEQGRQKVLSDWSGRWLNAEQSQDDISASSFLDSIFCGASDKPLKLWLRGSPFQLKVWEALMQIPDSRFSTYGAIASKIGQPGAARAVGTAVGANPLAWLVPCHRVIRQNGELGGYHWGRSIKTAMVGYEGCRSTIPDSAPAVAR